MSTHCCIILTTTDKKEIANMIANKLVEADLAACVQIDNITGIFKWKGELSSGEEFRLLIKAKEKNYKLIEQEIVKLHNYELPQIIKLDINDGLPSYLEWIINK